MKCGTYGIFQSFFNLRVLYYRTPNLFCLFDHVPTAAAQSYFIFYLLIFVDLKSDMIRLCNEQTKVTYTYFPRDF